MYAFVLQNVSNLFRRFDGEPHAFPGIDAARIALNISVAQLLRPSRADVAAGALYKTAVHHDELVLVWPQKCLVLLLGLASGLLSIPLWHVVCDGK